MSGGRINLEWIRLVSLRLPCDGHHLPKAAGNLIAKTHLV